MNDIDDDFQGSQDRPVGRATKWRTPHWLRRAYNRLINCGSRLRRRLPPWILDEKDVTLERIEAPWGSCISLSIIVLCTLCMGYLFSAVVILSRTWFVDCNVPLHVHAIVGAILMAPLVLVVFLSNFYYNSLVRYAWIVCTLLIAVWSLVGLSWIVGSSIQCRSEGAALFGLCICFVVLFSLPCLALFFFCGFQSVIAAVVQRGSIYGDYVPFLLSGTRPQRHGQLGVTLLGQGGTGKTSLLQGLNAHIASIFPPDGKCKIIDDSPMRFTVKANRITYNEEDATSMRVTDLVNADCVVLCFSLLDRRSFHALQRTWLPHAVAHCAVPVVIVGTHADRNLSALPIRPVSIHPAKADFDPQLLVPSTSPTFCMSNLSTSVVLRVFAYLPNADLVRAQLVCKLWADLGRHSFVWKRRSAGQISRADVKSWMSRIASQGILKPSGFSRVAAYFELDCTAADQRAMVSFWKRVSGLAQLNETKLYVARAHGELIFSRRPFEKDEAV